MSKQKILVTGASGFLGGRLCHELVKQGHRVKGLDLPSSDPSSLPQNPHFELLFGDVTNYQSLLQASSDCHVIFHVAAVVEPWLPRPSSFFTVNVGGLKNVLRVYREAGTIEKIIYTSSFLALGSTDGYVADETQMHSGKFFCSEYEKSKVLADKIARDAALEGVPIVPLYPGLIYGPGKLTTGNSVARLLIERFNGRLPGYIGNGYDKCSFSYVEDVVNGHIAAMHKGRPGERYLLTGENASLKDIFDIVAVMTQTKRPSFTIPTFILELYGWLSILIARITGKLPVISPPAMHILRHQWAYTCEKAKEELDYNPRSLKEGLSEVLLCLKELGLIKY